MHTEEVRVPDIGDFKEVDIIEVMVAEGDRVRRDQSLVTVESDKASMEIPSPFAGVVREMKVAPGDRVSEGSLLLIMDVDEAAIPAEEAPPVTPPPEEAGKPGAVPLSPAGESAGARDEKTAEEPSAHEKVAASGTLPYASPSIRKMARELGVDLIQVQGTGLKGRIVREDVQAFVRSALAKNMPSQDGRFSGHPDFPPWPSLDFSGFGQVETEPLSRIRRISGPGLHRNLIMIPHVVQYEDADVTELEAFRKAENKRLEPEGVRLTILSFVMKACVFALEKYPRFNASLDAKRENLLLKRYYNVAFAADTTEGLMVPVIRDVDKKGVAEIAREIADLAAKARDGRLSPSDMRGASFTITSLGGIGGTAFTPFINAPEVAILGLSRMSVKPVWNGSEFVPRTILPLSLAYDHRAIDGADGARFVSFLSEVLGEMKKTLL